MSEKFEITQIKVEGFVYPTAKIRADLVGKEDVPVGDEFYGSSEPLPYRWREVNADEDDDVFEVYLNGTWQDAVSIDWDFIS